MSSVSTDNTPHDQQLVHQQNLVMDINNEPVEVSPSSELTTRPFLGLGCARSLAVSVLSGRISRRSATHPGPSRQLRPTVEDIQESIGQVISAANITADNLYSGQRSIA